MQKVNLCEILDHWIKLTRSDITFKGDRKQNASGFAKDEAIKMVQRKKKFFRYAYVQE